MSLYQIPARNPRHRVEVGWYYAMGTFIAKVRDTARDTPLLSIGEGLPWVKSVERLRLHLDAYAVLSDEMMAALRADQARDKGRRRSRYERSVRTIVERCTMDKDWPRPGRQKGAFGQEAQRG